MSLRHVLLGVGLSASVCLVAVAPSCSYYSEVCTFGVWPPDGAVDVPTSDALILVHPGVFTDDVPALSPGISLRDRTAGRAVPFSVRLHEEHQRVFVTPDAPLTPGHVYELTGVNVADVHNVHRWYWFQGDTYLAVTSTFTVGDTAHRAGTGLPSDLAPAECDPCPGCDTATRGDTADSSDDVTLDDDPWVDTADTDLPADSDSDAHTDTDTDSDTDVAPDSDTDTDTTPDTDVAPDTDTDTP